MGALKVDDPSCTDLIGQLSGLTCLFHGAGSANLGAAGLLVGEAGVPQSRIFCTNSRGVIWRSEDGTTGSYRNAEQKNVAQVGS